MSKIQASQLEIITVDRWSFPSTKETLSKLFNI